MEIGQRVLKVLVKYGVRDGVHMFVSDDVPGLFVANKAREAAFRDLAPSIEACFKLNRNLDCEVIGAVSSFDELERDPGSIIPAWAVDAVREIVLRPR